MDGKTASDLLDDFLNNYPTLKKNCLSLFSRHRVLVANTLLRDHIDRKLHELGKLSFRPDQVSQLLLVMDDVETCSDFMTIRQRSSLIDEAMNLFLSKRSWKLVHADSTEGIRVSIHKASADIETPLSLKMDMEVSLPLINVMCALYEADLATVWVPRLHVGAMLKAMGGGHSSGVNHMDVYCEFEFPWPVNLRSFNISSFFVDNFESGSMLLVLHDTASDVLESLEDEMLPYSQSLALNGQIGIGMIRITPLSPTETNVCIMLNDVDMKTSPMPSWFHDYLTMKAPIAMMTGLKAAATAVEDDSYSLANRIDLRIDFYTWIQGCVDSFFRGDYLEGVNKSKIAKLDRVKHRGASGKAPSDASVDAVEPQKKKQGSSSSALSEVLVGPATGKTLMNMKQSNTLLSKARDTAIKRIQKKTLDTAPPGCVKRTLPKRVVDGKVVDGGEVILNQEGEPIDPTNAADMLRAVSQSSPSVNIDKYNNEIDYLNRRIKELTETLEEAQCTIPDSKVGAATERQVRYVVGASKVAALITLRWQRSVSRYFYEWRRVSVRRGGEVGSEAQRLLELDKMSTQLGEYVHRITSVERELRDELELVKAHSQASSSAISHLAHDVEVIASNMLEADEEWEELFEAVFPPDDVEDLDQNA